MVRRLAGFRKRTRHLLRKSVKERGKISITKYFQQFSIGEKAMIKFEPAYHKGMCSVRFHDRIGTVVGKRGECYELKIVDMGKEKKLIAHPVHLKKITI